MVDALGQRPERMTLTNVETAEVFASQYNPETIAAKVAPLWNDLAILGGTFQPKQYLGTKNQNLGFQLEFDARSFGGGDKSRDAINFLLSLCYKSRAAQDVDSGGAPRVLVVWPTLVSLVTVITDLAFSFTQFVRDGRVVYWSVDVTVDERRTTPLYSEDVRRLGLRRPE